MSIYGWAVVAVLQWNLMLKSQAVPLAPPQTETAILAGGCYWGMEEYFRKIDGVVATRVGFAGGHKKNPHYDETHDGSTGHAESVEIKFNPVQVSYETLLDHFFKMHDPTTLNRQGNDVGTQYRSAIFTTSDDQKRRADLFKKKVESSKAWKEPIVTEIRSPGTFWPAHEDHQKYLVKHPGGYDNHKVRDLKF